MKSQALTDAMIDEISRIFGALGDISRLRILRALLDAGAPLSQQQVVAATGLSQANASKHLGHLVQVGLILREPQGIQVFYRPVLPLVADACDLMCGYATRRIQSAYQSLR